MTGTRPTRRVAVVGAGISGLAAAWHLADHAQVTLFEADPRFGGHAHTVDVTIDDTTHGVDTGFLVFNHATYPHLRKLFADLGVDTAPSEMSFSVQVPGPDGRNALEWSGCNLDTVFAQRRNLVNPRFLGMLRDLLRFNRVTTQIAEAQQEAALQQPIGEFLTERGFSNAFRDWYLLPMLGCIWSCPTDQMLRFPVATMIRFCHNHGLIRVTDRPQWYTVRGGSKHYVQRMLQRIPDARAGVPVRAVRRLPPDSGHAGVWIDTDHGSERFDEVVLAGHSDQSLALLGNHASADERAVLGAIGYHRNRAVLHTDASVLPERPKAWAAWNYLRAPQHAQEQSAVCLHYLINRLQPLPWQQPVVVSLNPVRDPAPATVLGEYDYAHPVFDLAAIAAQVRVPLLQGQSHVWFAGAWTRYGFHEDGLMSGMAVAEGLRARWAAEITGTPVRAAA
ncbi:NAD(P)/FAD-dependent oxidoreductase [Pseudaquabacterium pictum]|uniref:Dehydrogenase n=1 Tax=Pseudaquabacterium pictum TaxID=2315236 RepID=A0A480AXX5_9BURK|nr:FAD-dependent oxidoreductase [Rubrivivax pictus]GCL65810.1 dehydrogenase [Rubrivivax pictus]